jgi:hypothetical protein
MQKNRTLVRFFAFVHPNELERMSAPMMHRCGGKGRA